MTKVPGRSATAARPLAAVPSYTFVGTATGKRYDIYLNGIIHTIGGGAGYFPGSTAGLVATGGQYA